MILKAITTEPNSKCLVSKFVNIFTSSVDTSHLREVWARELGVPIADELWEESLASIQNCSINSRYRLIQFKVLHRLHYSKSKLHKMYPSISPMCNRCHSAEGSLSHLFWHCPILDTFWSKIFNWFSTQLKENILPDPKLAVLGCSDNLASLTSNQNQILKLGMVAAKKIILLDWKSPLSPCFNRWLNEMLSIARMEQICSCKGKPQEDFLSIWNPFLSLLRNNQR